MRAILIIIFIVFLSTFACAEIYKWVDENGRIHFSDKPQNPKAEYYVPQTDSSFDGGSNSEVLEGPATNQSRMNSSDNRKSAKELARIEKL